MPGNLANHIAAQFEQFAARDWTVRRECPVFDTDWAHRIGYTPLADLMLERRGGPQRVWVELEISRADPVANHAKYSAARLFDQWRAEDTFVAMVSPHVATGRRVLAAHTVALMRQQGMQAFQTVLFPQLSGSAIKHLNHLMPTQLVDQCPPTRPEFDRLLTISRPALESDAHRILYASDPSEVRWNTGRWNRDVATAAGRDLWRGRNGYRAVEHFTWWPADQLFAPTKFTAFVPAGGQPGMTLELYAQLDETEKRFDGHLAWRHLERIGFSRVDLDAEPDVLAKFHAWLLPHAETLRVRGNEPVLWRAPAWA